MRRPIVIASGNGLRVPTGPGGPGVSCIERAMEILRGSGDPLEAVVEGVTIVEDDPAEMSVGYGGLPNTEGEVELDACVMHGPSGRGGAVAGLRRVRHAARLARCVMERSEHVMLVGDGALRFALQQGFTEEELLTEAARAAWLKWREGIHPDASRGPTPHHPVAPSAPLAARRSPLAAEARGRSDDGRADVLGSEQRAASSEQERSDAERPTGTITCLAVDGRGDLAGVTTTSGMAFKLPGRVGDSPLIGCGLFVDNAVGAAGATGLGEECILVAGAHTVVEAMRRGLSPTEAALEALRRVAARHGNDPGALGRFGLQFYAINKEGEHGAASLRPGVSYALHDGATPRKVACASLLRS
jgi:N4-(beta-N-acetylglucosaminyl)-L-asparaginase